MRGEGEGDTTPITGAPPNYLRSLPLINIGSLGPGTWEMGWLEFHFIFSPDCIFIITKEVSLWVRKQFVTLMAADAGERRQEFYFKFMGIKTIIYGNTGDDPVHINKLH